MTDMTENHIGTLHVFSHHGLVHTIADVRHSVIHERKLQLEDEQGHKVALPCMQASAIACGLAELDVLRAKEATAKLSEHQRVIQSLKDVALNGRCTCCGEGTCEWCCRTAVLERKAKVLDVDVHGHTVGEVLTSLPTSALVDELNSRGHGYTDLSDLGPPPTAADVGGTIHFTGPEVRAPAERFPDPGPVDLGVGRRLPR